MGKSEGEFDSARAELFEAIAHPVRIRILQELEPGPLGFAELKKKVGLESSGHLAFHLGKLERLVETDAQGQYALSGEGKEALRMVQTVRDGGGKMRVRLVERVRVPKLAMVALAVAVILLTSVVVVQLGEIQTASAGPPGTIDLGGTRYWHASLPLSEVPLDGNLTISLGGVLFVLYPSQYGHGTLISAWPTTTLANGTVILHGGTFTIVPEPDVLVSFPDGAAETMSYSHTVSSSNHTSINYSEPAFPWFTSHTGPRAAVVENTTSVTLYVSA